MSVSPAIGQLQIAVGHLADGAAQLLRSAPGVWAAAAEPLDSSKVDNGKPAIR
ncbi:hypothetical protein NFX37_08480 [Serratia marcescens]|nr:hypothetical protein NFX37_08480 [Serratia marcescens]